MNEILLNTQTRIELRSRDGGPVGLGGIEIAGLPMRDATRPICAEIRTPDGLRFVPHRVRAVETVADSTVIRLEVQAVADGPMEYMLHTVRARHRTGDWSQPPSVSEETELRLELKPITRSFGSRTFQGFAYRWVWSSPDHPIYRILDLATWEPGGDALDCEFWLRNATSPSIWRPESAETYLSTEWHLPGIHQPNIFQYLPYQTQLCGFTLTHSARGVLLNQTVEPGHIRSLFEKERGSRLLVHRHEHCGDLAHDFSTHWMEVLWCPEPVADEVDRYNLWESIREALWSDLNQKVGLEPVPVSAYAVMEEWGLPDVDRYIEEGLPKVLEFGAKTIMIPSWEFNNMNTWGASNMCCVVDWNISDHVGEDRFKTFCSIARDAGARIEMWANTALSGLQFCLDLSDENEPSPRITPLARKGRVWEKVREAKHPWVRNPAGHIEADHYAPVFCQVNMRDPIMFDHWQSAWKRYHDEFGLGGFFLDSSFNMSCDKFSFLQCAQPDAAGPKGATIDQLRVPGSDRPDPEPPAAIESQYFAYLKMLVEMQRNGLQVCTEDVGAFGIGRSGPGILARLASLPMWLDTICVFDAELLKEDGHDPEEVFFRGLAYRVMWFLYWCPQENVLSWRQDRPNDPAHLPTSEQSALFQAYSRAWHHFGTRTIHEGERAVEYRRDGRRLIFTLQPLSLDLDGPRRITNLITQESRTADRLESPARQIFLIETP
ncbi:MAG: hypothetical protein MH204_04635 [Fimbriimonadaceae bacterium]|nr:hypothetical protein [Fimbriimonadaceae bacterium]